MKHNFGAPSGNAHISNTLMRPSAMGAPRLGAGGAQAGPERR